MISKRSNMLCSEVVGKARPRVTPIRPQTIVHVLPEVRCHERPLRRRQTPPRGLVNLWRYN
jgi:hypothetical protein